MCLRVLGYTNEVESKGTWPTNYIAKAQDLKLMKDISYGSYNDGAKRGNVALLVWNMLRTPMWEVTSESEGDGLVSAARREMINVKFPDYEYYDEDLELVVTDIDVKDGKVTIEAESEKDFIDADGKTTNYIRGEIAEDVEFVNLFGRTVAILYNSDEEKIIMVTPSSDDEVVEGFWEELSDEADGDYNFDAIYSGEDEERELIPEKAFIWGKISGDFMSNSYTVANVGTRRNIDSVTEYVVRAGIVDSVKVKNDEATVKFSYGSLNTSVKMDADAIVLVDGTWGNFEDIEEGVVLTELLPGELYAITTETVTGSLDEVKYEEDREIAGNYVVVDGEEYKYLTTDEAVEIDEDGEDVAETFLGDIMSAKKDEPNYKFYDEEATLYFNFVGEVMRIEFEEIEDLEAVGHFYALTNKVPTWTVSDKSGTTTYVELNGESYEVKSDVDVSEVSGEAGKIVFVKFDSKDRVKEMTLVEASVPVDKYTVLEGVLDDNNYIGESKVNDSTVVLKVTAVNDEDDDEVVDHYEVETLKGAEELENVDYILYCYETEDDFMRVKYAFIFEDGTSDDMYGIVEKYTYSKGIVYLTIDGEKYEVDEDFLETSENGTEIKELLDSEDGIVGALIVYAEGSDGIKIKEAGFVDDVTEGGIQVTRDNVDSELSFTWAGSLFDMDIFENEIDKNCKVLYIEVSEDDDVEGEYNFESVEEVSIEDITLRKDDIVVISAETAGEYNTITSFVVVRGFEEMI